MVPDGQALDKALELADLISANGPLAVQAILKTIRDTEGMHEEEAFQIDAQLGMKVFMSADARRARGLSVRSGRPSSRASDPPLPSLSGAPVPYPVPLCTAPLPHHRSPHHRSAHHRSAHHRPPIA